MQNCEVNIVYNVIIIQKANTKLSEGQHGPPKKLRREDQVQRRSKHPLLTGHTRHEPLVEIRYMGLPVVKASLEMTV
jgi:hypothetical protein